jgi:hypothetical protein
VVSLLPWQERLPVEPRHLISNGFNVNPALRAQHQQAKWAHGVFVFKTESCALSVWC